MFDFNANVEITELTWPLSESELGLVWQLPNLPSNFLDRIRLPRPADVKCFLVQAQQTASSPLLDARTLAATVCTIPDTAGYARVWPPLVLGDTPQVAESVLGAVADFSDVAVLAVVDSTNTVAQDQFTSSGYAPLCKVLHLVETGKHVQSELSFEDDARVTLRPVTKDGASRFFGLIQHTYEQTDDCPALSITQSMDEVRLRWDQTEPSEREKYWFTVTVGDDHNATDVGCLVLGMPTQSKNVEVIYMGIVPEQRRKGYGTELIRFAKRTRLNAERETLTLSVDADNLSALGCYTQNGFSQYAESNVFLSVQA